MSEQLSEFTTVTQGDKTCDHNPIHTVLKSFIPFMSYHILRTLQNSDQMCQPPPVPYNLSADACSSATHSFPSLSPSGPTRHYLSLMMVSSRQMRSFMLVPAASVPMEMNSLGSKMINLVCCLEIRWYTMIYCPATRPPTEDMTYFCICFPPPVAMRLQTALPCGRL